MTRRSSAMPTGTRVHPPERGTCSGRHASHRLNHRRPRLLLRRLCLHQLALGRLHCHPRRHDCRRDDLESTAYMLVYMLRGTVPWSGLRVMRGENRYFLSSDLSGFRTF